MKITKKTDHFNLGMKLDLRRKLLDQFHKKGPINVFDACQGPGVIWANLRAEYKIDSYWGMDLKPRSGRLAGDSVRVLESPIKENVIDIDTYGSPWKHWQALLPNIWQPTTVFLTKGFISKGLSTISRNTMELLGLKAPWLKPVRVGYEIHGHRFPSKLQMRLDVAAIPYWIAHATNFAKLIEWYEGKDGNAYYIGVRLEPK